MKHDLAYAIDMAAAWHEGQYRRLTKNKLSIPYITHPFKVLMNLISLTHGEATAEMRCAAVLHDVLEDCDTGLYKDIVDLFGKEVAELCFQLKKGDFVGTRAQRKKLERERLSGVSDEALIIKVCDRIANIDDLVDSKMNPDDLKWAILYLEETVELANMIMSKSNLEVFGHILKVKAEQVKTNATYSKMTFKTESEK